jgi:hypothetical protein
MGYVNGHPMLMELVGVAGSGKSTLRKMLKEMNPQIDVVSPPPKFYYLMPILKILFRWFPLYLQQYSKTRWFSMQEIKIIGYLDCWLPYLRRCAVEKDMLVVLDPGSIYWLTALKSFGPELTRDPKFQTWWETMRKKWLSAIDIFVWLDAPTELLIERVQEREEWHESKLMTHDETAASFDLYRKGYSELIDLLSKKQKNHVLIFQTDQTPTDVIFNQVKELLDEGQLDNKG